MSGFLWICLGGAIGTGARYLLSSWTLKAFGDAFPHGTLAVNLIGSFLIGSLMSATIEGAISPTVRLTLATGVLGGFTTYSSFSYETLRYLHEGAWALALLNVLLTLGGCLAACALGWAGTRALFGA